MISPQTEPAAKHGRFEKHEDPDRAAETQKRRMPKWLKILLIVLACILGAILLAAAIWFWVNYARGKKQLTADFSAVTLMLPTEAVEGEAETEEADRIVAYDDGKTVRYRGTTYRLNEDLSTVLFLGIDRDTTEGVEEIGTGGMSDVVLLLVLDNKTGDLNVLNIPRDTLTEITVYAASGERIGFEDHQICMAYSYGDGRERSCENAVEAVTHLIYGMPIMKYISMDMAGVYAANESIGGVTIKAKEEFQMPNGTVLQEGDTYTLHGKELDFFIREREDAVDSSKARMARQKQFVQAFAAQLSSQAKRNFSVISKLFEDLSPYYVSNLDLSDVIYLSRIYLDKQNVLQFVTFEGQYDSLENYYGQKNPVFYPDEQSLFETVLSLFYLPVEE